MSTQQLNPLLIFGTLNVAAVVRKGGSVRGDGNMGPDDPIWVEFAQAMKPMVAMSSESIAKLMAAPSKL